MVEAVLPEAAKNLVSPKEPVIGHVVSNDVCLKGKSNAFVRHTVIDVAGTPLEGNCLAGQSFGVIAPGVDENGKPHKVRLYSIANGSCGEDGKGNLISTTPKRLIEEFWPQKPGDDPERHTLFIGVCSNHLCDLQPGAEVKVTGPNGKRFLMPVDLDAHDYIFLATGTGIAPFRGFCLDLLVNRTPPCGSQIHLIMGSPYTSDLLYDDLFRKMADEHENFHYHTAISREPRPGSSRGIYVDSVIDEKMDLFGPLLENPRTLMYMCGLIGMQFGIYQVLARHGVGGGFMTVKDELAGVASNEWTKDQMKRQVKPTARMMVEVY
jgi:ferredoxin--NADP+ reductase